jgi:CBS-domain-containing membrane protein
MQQLSIAVHTSGGADSTVVVQYPATQRASELEESEVLAVILRAILGMLGGTIIESANPESGATTLTVTLSGGAHAEIGPAVFRRDVLARLGVAYQ